MLAITGTPGVGKTTVAEILKKKGYKVASVNDLARKYDCIEEVEGEFVVDMEKLREKFSENLDFIEGHLSHFLSDKCVVLRCNPLILKKRMKSKGWDEEKILENLESELIDQILVEALEVCSEVHEIDTTDKTPEEVADLIEKIYLGKLKLGYGKIDWISVVGDKIEEITRI